MTQIYTIKRILVVFGLLLFLFLGNSLIAQDIHFSQFERSPLNLNPALAGNFNGDFRLVANHRNQWQAITTPYRTLSFSFDGNLKEIFKSKSRFGYGLLINSDKAGDSDFGMIQIGLAMALQFPLSDNGKLFATLGLVPSYNQKSLDYAKLKFNSDFVGGKYDPDIGIDPGLSGDNLSYIDLAAGLTFDYIHSKNFNISSGFSLMNITSPSQSFLNNPDIKLDRRINIHSLATIRLKDNLELQPGFLYMRQGKFDETNIGGTIILYTNNASVSSLFAGTWYRAKDAVVIKGGFEYKKLQIGLSYDINSSKLNNASRGQGGLELSFIYIFSKTKVIAPQRPCPDFL